MAAVLDVHVELLEGVLVHEQLDALARGQLAALVLGVDARLPAAEPRLRPPPLQLVQHFFHGRCPRQARRVLSAHSMAVVHCEIVNACLPSGQCVRCYPARDDPARGRSCCLPAA